MHRSKLFTITVFSKIATDLIVGSTEQLVETIAPSDATNQSVEWSSSDETVASVNNGLVTAIAEGTAIITATTVDGNHTANCTVTVETEPADEYLVYDFESGDLRDWNNYYGGSFTNNNVTDATETPYGTNYNQQGRYHLVGGPGAGEIRTRNFVLGGDGLITFKIGGEYVQSWHYLGLFSAVDHRLLMWEFEGETSPYPHTYSDVSFDASAYIGQECYIKLVDRYESYYNDPNTNLDNLRIPVQQLGVAVDSINFSAVTDNIELGSKFQFEVDVYPTDADNNTLLWESNYNDIASVDQNGLVTANSLGWTYINVTSSDGGYHLFKVVYVVPVLVDDVTVSPAELNLAPDETAQLVPTVMPENAADKSVEWSTSDSSVATVNASGEVYAQSIGSAVITVTTNDGGYSATCLVTVNDVVLPEFLIYDFETADLQGWTVTGDAFSPGDVTDVNTYWGAELFNQEGTYHLWGFTEGGDGETGEMRTENFVLGGDGQIAFKIGGGQIYHELYLALYDASNNEELMRETGVNDEAYQSKVFNAASYIGTECYMKLVDNATSGWGHINLDSLVIPIPQPVFVTGLTLNINEIQLAIGISDQLSATIYPQNATNDALYWSSSNETVATVNENGFVTAISVGIADIVVTTVEGGYTDTCIVEVVSIPVESVMLESHFINLIEGKNRKLSAIIHPNNATNKEVEWWSSDTTIAKVDKNGLVTADQIGITTIVVTTIDGGHSDSCTVRISEVPYAIIAEPDAFEILLHEGDTVLENISLTAHGDRLNYRVHFLSTKGVHVLFTDHYRSIFQSEIEGLGAISSVHTGAFTSSVLDTIDVLVVGEELDVDSTEIVAIRTWIESGGNILIDTDSNFTALNEILNGSEIHYSETQSEINTDGYIIAGGKITDNIINYSYQGTCRTLLLTYRKTLDPIIYDRFCYDPFNNYCTYEYFAAYCKVGDGKVIALADETLDDVHISETGHLQLGLNAIKWFGPGWVKTKENEGYVLQDSTKNIELVFDATNMNSGEYPLNIFVQAARYNDVFYLEDEISVKVTILQGAQPDYLVYDFETADLQGWTATGNAFSVGDVTNTDIYWDGNKFKQEGKWHLWGFNEGGDGETGELRTENFVLGGDGQIGFMIAGGNIYHELYIALYDATTNTELMRETGVNDEAYRHKLFDAEDYIGTACYIKLIDNAAGGWGHINLDSLVIPITQAVAVEGVVLSPTSVTLKEGTRQQLVAIVLPPDASNKIVSWSSNIAAATVDDKGIVTAVSEGVATITVTTFDGGYAASCLVTVEEAPVAQFLTYNFETRDLQGWIVSGNAFSVGDVSNVTTYWDGRLFNHEGNWHLWGYQEGGDGGTGEMRTENFTLGGDGQITFKLGGGQHYNLYIALYDVNGNELMRQVTANDEGYSDYVFEATAYIGTECYIMLVDNATGGFGHINLDDLVIPVISYPIYFHKPIALNATDINSVKEELKLYPNPLTDGLLNLELKGFEANELLNINITNVIGNAVFAEQFEYNDLQNKLQVHLDDLKSGMYVLTVKSSSRAMKSVFINSNE